MRRREESAHTLTTLSDTAQLLRGAVGGAVEWVAGLMKSASAAATPGPLPRADPSDAEAEDSADSVCDVPHAVQLRSTACGLLLYLLLEPADEKVAVDLLPDATVGDLKAAAFEAGGPKPHEQELVVGSEELTEPDATELSDTNLIASEVTVTVRRRTYSAALSVAHERGAVLLRNGCVVSFVHGKQEVRRLGPGTTSVAAGSGFTAAAVDGRLEVWGLQADPIQRGMRKQLRGHVCSVAARAGTLAAVTAAGDLFMSCVGGGQLPVPPLLRGTVSAASVGGDFTVVLRTDGSVAVFGHAAWLRRQGIVALELGGRLGRAVSAGLDFCAVLMDDGTVVCAGAPRDNQCSVPLSVRDAVSVTCGDGVAAAVLAGGRVRWWGVWGPEFAEGPIGQAGPCVAVALSSSYAVAVTADGELVADCTRKHLKLSRGSWSTICKVPDTSQDEIALRQV
eukprot:TRINITY_DN14010_c0_g1_i1.p1 TRINITY_DN14010_c0_g1~~TRINITY_DN14010_c0_g1_i1.p1  ORF type:complete len:474 (+),score=167.37 TRINITY_DN14010_c0_g1_i1:70-1422(+)